MPTLDPRQYSPAVGEWIALEYASGEPGTELGALHRSCPDRVPAPLIVARWRSVWPAFDALMREAESARARALMAQTVTIADSDARGAAHAKNSIAARWRLAEMLAPDVVVPRGVNAPGGGVTVTLSDDQLLAIARGVDPLALLGALAGEAPGPPTGPPVCSGARLVRGDRGGHVSSAQSAFETPDSAIPDIAVRMLL